MCVRLGQQYCCPGQLASVSAETVLHQGSLLHRQVSVHVLLLGQVMGMAPEPHLTDTVDSHPQPIDYLRLGFMYLHPSFIMHFLWARQLAAL